ncbi:MULTISPECIES: amino-acid N-acetyltransferase [Acinetobacter]|jgi:amino-acid N-acetyltransferase|uniref:Amino-acid acetyltransferase n=2 Tax=Acinetobacter schindleri TaxID=108981 RepID=N9APZ4_9GAMM|nr:MULTISPECIES: amino-acid N-acetyltransferase [Acinetobacter]AWD70119.1 amino-acid N-acetyltransferase [Acinetobacter schindleri]ENV14112.1 amino-acid N-acetyltransferase [Acinetobacter schindleri NIPH 900]ENV45805.1 amino-acid N-acetyltransferase [Acinetobacter schindleri CIP 107287]ENX03441.1 amino-acid N-acetyltransferase [Acinetobacter sp. CIP 101934]MCK8641920.1 amino-acid N-acetyltransferase [Acinetobacter schindleri]
MNPAEPSQSTTLQYVHWFRHSAPYINAHRNKTFVIMFDGEAVLHDNFQHIIHDIALLHSLGIHLILVHGARPQINLNLAASQISTPFHRQRRITTRESLSCVMNAVGSIRLQIEALLSMGLANSPMYGARIDVVSGNFVTAKPYGIRDGIDFQLTGEVRTVDTNAIQRHLDSHNIVVLGPTGYSTTGEVFNLLAEEVATKTAIRIKADKLIFLGKQHGLLNTDGQLQREVQPSQLDAYMMQDAQDLPSELSLQLRAAQEASMNGVNRVHLISYAHDGALLEELFTRDGSGTLITDAHYEDVRMATIQDVGGLINLLRPLEEEGILVYRSRERLENEIEQFAVIERDGMILACAALYPIPTTGNELRSAEIACVAVDPSYRKSNRGSQILNYLEDKARSMGIQQLFILTTRTAHWFLEQGFEQSSVDDLPDARQALYNYQRNSLVCKKSL